MKAHSFTFTGAQATPVDQRDYKLLGGTGEIPKVYMQEKAWSLPVHYQRDIPACGAHAGAWLKMLLDEYEDTGNEYSPRYTWAKIKEFDGFRPEDGTDMRSILKSLTKDGGLPYELLGNDTTLPLQVYTKPKITAQMDKAAAVNRASSYGFATPDSMDAIKRLIFLNKGVIILLRLGSEWWTSPRGRSSWKEKDILPLRPPKNIVSGHFVVAHSYDEKYIYFYNMWSENWGRKGHGYFDERYLPFINALGTASDLVENPAPVSRFERNLRLGSTGEDVRELQRFLNRSGFPVATRGAGSRGLETDVFGPRTQAALAHFQKSQRITPASGFFGPKTREIVNLANQAITGKASTISAMDSTLFTLNVKDFIRGAVTALLGGVLFATYGVLSTAGFDVFSADWTMIGKLAVNGAFGGFVGYIGKRFISDDAGHTLGAKSL